MPIVERVGRGRGCALTEGGWVLARHAATVTTALEPPPGDLAELRGLRAGRVRIAAFPSASSTVVPRVIAAVTARRPGGLDQLRREGAARGHLGGARGSRRHRAHLPATPATAGEQLAQAAAGLSVRRLGDDDTVVVVPAEHPAATDGPDRPLAARGGAMDRGLPPVPRGTCSRPAGGRASPRHRVRDRQLHRRREPRRARRRHGVPAAHGGGIPPLPAGIAVPRLPAAEARTLHVVTARGGPRACPAVGAALEVVAEVLADHRPGNARR